MSTQSNAQAQSARTIRGTRSNWVRSAELARGGSARLVVVAAEDGPAKGRVGVLKELLPSLWSDAPAADRLRDEGLLTERLASRAIPAVLDRFELEGRPVFVMQHLQGQSLFHLRRRMNQVGVQWPKDAREELYAALLDALGHVHDAPDLEGRSRAIVHRDVSPENVVIGYDGRVWLIDFGIATSRSARRREVCGKARHMAPEQARGDYCDGRADLFALGTMMWEDYAGVSAWGSEEVAEILRSLAVGRPLPSVRDVPGVDPAIAAVIDRVCEMEPDRRPETSHVLRAALIAATGPISTANTALAALMGRLFAGERALANRREQVARMGTTDLPVAAPAAPTPLSAAALDRMTGLVGVSAAGLAITPPGVAVGTAGVESALLPLLPVLLAGSACLGGIRPSNARIEGSRAQALLRFDGGRVAMVVAAPDADRRIIQISLHTAFLSLASPSSPPPTESDLLAPARSRLGRRGRTLVAPAPEDPMHTAQTLLSQAPNLRAVVVSDRDGTVENVAGDADADMLAAVASLTLRQLEDVADLLALGEVSGWSVTNDQGGMVVVQSGSALVTGVANSPRAAEAAWRTLSAAAGAK